MARNNLAWIKGDITGDIYYDNPHLDGLGRCPVAAPLSRWQGDVWHAMANELGLYYIFSDAKRYRPLRV